MRGASQFFVDFLVEDPWGRCSPSGQPLLVSAPSSSPEHHGLVVGPTIDHQIIRGLLRATAEAAWLVDGDNAALPTQLIDVSDRVAPNSIGRHGQLQEWMEDWDDPQDTHRHISHLFDLYPGAGILPGQPEFEAARISLRHRGDGGPNWSKAWKMNCWARLLDGDRSHALLIDAMRKSTYPNLFSASFQIDGNVGVTAGVAEMLLQSHRGELHLLPALPQAWFNGKVVGLCARGGFLVDITWARGTLHEATVLSRLGGQCIVRSSVALMLGGEKLVPNSQGTFEIDTQPSRLLTLRACRGVDGRAS